MPLNSDSRTLLPPLPLRHAHVLNPGGHRRTPHGTGVQAVRLACCPGVRLPECVPERQGKAKQWWRRRQ